MVQHNDSIRNLHHQPHVMLDQQDRQLKFFLKLYQQLVQFFCLLPIHASCRFIEQQQKGISSQRPSNLQTPLGGIG